VLPLRADSRVKAQSQAAVPSAPSIQWQEAGNRLELNWDTSAARHVSVTHQLGSTRTALAVNLAGGHAVLDVAALPRGGEYEFSLSNGLDAHLILVRR
jgi:hypothetical protein